MNDRKTRPEAKTALRTRNKAFEPPGLRAPARALLIMNARAYYIMPAITSRRSLRLTQETPRREGVANGLQGQSERALKRPKKRLKQAFDNSTTPRITAYSLYNFENTILDKTHNLLTKANSAQNKNRYRRWYYTSYAIIVHKAHNYQKSVWLEKKRHKKIKKVIIIYSYTNYIWGVCISCFSRTYTPPRV